MSLSSDLNAWHHFHKDNLHRSAERHRETWDCAACKTVHSFRVERVKLQDGRVICMRRFASGRY